MNRQVVGIPKLALAGAVLLALSACGGGGGDDPPPTPPTSSVKVAPSLGMFSTGTPVVVRSLAGAQVGSGSIGSDGTATVNIGTHSGPILVSVSGGGTVNYFNEATGTTENFPAGKTLEAVAPAGSTSVGVTVLSDAVKRKLEAAGGLANANNAAINAANAKVAAVFGLTSAISPPALIGTATANVDASPAGRYALILAAIASSGTAGAKPHEIAESLAQDLSDDKLDGKQGETAVPGVVLANFDSTTFADALVAAATEFADDATQAQIEAEKDLDLIVVNPTPEDVSGADPTLSAGIAAARQAIRDVRISAALADEQLSNTGTALNEAVQLVSDSTRLSIEHFQLIDRAATFLRDLRAGNPEDIAPVNGRWEKRWEPSPGMPGMRCSSSVANTPESITGIKCGYANLQGRNPNAPTEWSRFALTLTPGEAAGAVNWDAFMESSVSGQYDDTVTKLFGSTKDGVFTVTETDTSVVASMKGDVPFGFGGEDKHNIDATLNATETLDAAGNASGSGTLVASITRSKGEKTAKIEVLEGSTLSFRDRDEVVFGALKLKASTGVYALAGNLSLGDSAVLPTVFGFSGTLSKGDGVVAEVSTEVTRKAIDQANGLDAGTVSLAAKVVSANGVTIKLALGLDRATAGDDTVTMSLTHELGARKLTLQATLDDGEVSGPVTLTGPDNISVSLSENANGVLIGSIKQGTVEVGTINDSLISFKDGTTESLG